MPEDLLGNQMQWSCRREVSAQTSHSSEDHVASGTPAALISPKRNEQRKQTKCGVRCPEMPIRRIWVELEGNKDHLLSQARSDPAKREIHVESLNKCIGDLQKYERRRKTGHCRTYKTNLLNLVENTLDCKRSCFERKELSTQIRSKHEMRKNGWCAGTTSWRVLDAKNSEKITRLFNSSLSNCNMQEQTNSMKSSGEFQDIESNYSGRLSHVCGQPEMIPNSRALLSRDKRLPLDIRNQSKVQGTVLGNHFLTFDSLRDFTQRISSGDVQKNEKQPLEIWRWKQIWEVKTDKIMAHFQCRCLLQDRWVRILNIWLTFRRITLSDSKDGKCRNYNSTSSPHPSSFGCGKQD